MLAGDVEYQEQQEGKGFLVHDVGKSSEWVVSPSMFRECFPRFASSGTHLLLSFRTH